MTQTKKNRALLSVSDKTGIADFAKGLHALGYEILSTGGTASTLRDAGLTVTDVSEVTGYGELLDGRVKTLHPAVHGGILAMRANKEHMQQLRQWEIEPIDLVAINLYPFKDTIQKQNVTLADAIENIDIGGPTLLRAAAKNWNDVVAVTDPEDYASILEQLQNQGVDEQSRYRLACKVFAHTAAYDALVADYLTRQAHADGALPPTLTLTYEKVQDMRYGENPHQRAAFYREPVGSRGNGLADAVQLHGKELSFNNINDANGALDLLKEFPAEMPCAVAVKHANPCGVGWADTLLDAYAAAYEADPVSIFGGIVAVNREVDAEVARRMAEIFLEIILAPSFSAEAQAILQEKKNIRLLQLPALQAPNHPSMLDLKKVAGGLLVQELNVQEQQTQLQVVTDRAPSPQEMQQLEMAWRVVKHTKSNGIVLSGDSGTVGIGPGQTSRVGALELAIHYAGERARGSVMASDAYFPFKDCVELAAKTGITAIIQPGGSVRDAESIDACNAAGIAMVFTGMRHFKH